jgi:hypothetical protein
MHQVLMRSLARPWQAQDGAHRQQARQMLATIYAWFDADFDTPYLQEARNLLAELAPEHE